MFGKIFCAAILGFLALSSSNAHAVSVRLAVAPSPIVGSPFSISAFVDGIDVSDPLLAFSFNTSIPGDWSLQSSAVVGPLFNDDSLFFGGDPEVAGSVFPGVFGGDILLATLTYTSGSAGMFLFQITSDLTDPNEGLFFESFNVADLSIGIQVRVNSDGTVIPEPATIAMLGGGLILIGLGGVRRRHSRQAA